MNVIKDFVASPMIVLGIETATLQIVPIICLTLFIALFIVVRRPFDRRLENCVLIVNNLCYSVVLIMFLVIDKN